MAVATDLAAMSASCARGDRRVNASACIRAGARWNASGSENGAGDGVAAGSHTLPSAATGAAAVCAVPVRDELDILIHSRRRDYSQLVQCWADENLLELE